MKCPKCGNEIPFYDLKPNCSHCGVNIMYYTQEEGLARDAKRTELESASARMIIARVKAEFIKGKLAVFRMIAVLAMVAALLVPYGGAHYTLPFFDGKFSVGILGIVQGIQSGLLLKIPVFLKSALVSGQTRAACVPAAVFVITVILDVIIFGAFFFGFLNLTKAAEVMKKTCIVGMIVSVIGQAASLIVKFTTHDSPAAKVTMGFGALVSCAMLLVVYLINSAMLKKGIEPVYRENDIKRKEMLKQYRRGEINLDDLPLPIFESEEEHEERIKALEEALKAEEEGKEL